LVDDGVGMDEETVSVLNRRVKGADNTETGSGGFGLYNVNQRMRYFFGDEYGLDMVSKEGEGTTCILTVPGLMEKK
ncbi:MAG: histidine kinase, partial [Acetatifactor sp.]|nr:histidine kinase [Acetatifactor sp.]